MFVWKMASACTKRMASMIIVGLPNWRNFEVYTAPAGVQDATGRIKIADLHVE